MGRWEPGAAGRLRAAALQLYVERGYEQTTVAEIAQQAGLTARTFFRHYADKREVLFAGSAQLQDELVRALRDSPESSSPLTAIGAALDAAAAMIGTDREFSRQRQQVIAANPELTERELSKLASLARALAAGLRERGTAGPEAELAAEAGVAVFRVAFGRWVGEPVGLGLAELMRESLDQLRALAS